MLMLHYFLAERSPSFVMSHTIVLLLLRCISVKTDITEACLIHSAHPLCFLGEEALTPWKEHAVDCRYRRCTPPREDMRLCHTGIFMGVSMSSGQSLVIGPAAVDSPVWGVALRLPCFSESTRPFACSLNVLTAVMWQTSLFCFHGALLLSMSVMESFDPAFTPFDAVKASTATCNFPCISQSLSWANWWFDIWYVENVKWGLFSPSAMNPFSAPVWNGFHFSVRCCKVPLTLCTTSAVGVLHWFTWLVWLCFTTLVTCEWAWILLWECNVMLRRTVEVFRDRMHWCVCAVDLRLRCCLLVERPEILALVLY